MKLLSRKEYLKLALEESYGVQKADNKVYLIADAENNENEKALYPVRIEEFSHWELRNGGVFERRNYASSRRDVRRHNL